MTDMTNVNDEWNPKLLRGLCEHMTPKATLEVIAQACDATVAANPGKPAATYASINANLIRKAMESMVDGPRAPTVEAMLIRPEPVQSAGETTGA